MNKDKKSILIVDDEVSLVEAMAIKFENQKKYNVSVAKDGIEAIDKIKKEKIDLIILDLLMPNASGFDVLQYLKESNINIPVFISTNFNNTENKQKLEEHKIVGLFVKAETPLNSIVSMVDNYFKI